MTAVRVLRPADERGSALLEVIVVGVALLVPLAYLGLAAATVQSGAFASSQAVREAARAFATAATPEQGRARAAAAVRLALGDHGFTAPADAVRVSCAGAPCLTPGSAVEVRLDWEVPVPWVPTIVGDGPASVRLSAEHRVPVDDYRRDAAWVG